MDSQASTNSSSEIRAELFLLSAVALFFELVAIRWLSSEIRAFSIYKNFPLIACYVGLGFGFMRDASANKWFKFFPLFLLILVSTIASSDWTGLTYVMTPGMRVSISHSWWDATHPPAIALNDPMYYLVFSVVVFFALLVLVALTFASLGQRLGKLFNSEKPLEAYLVNLLGSATGIAVFSILSFLCQPPVVWVSVGCLAAAWPYRKQKLAWLAFVAAIAIVGFMPGRGMTAADKVDLQAKTYWSPYHRFDVSPLFYGDKEKDKNAPLIGYTIAVNKAFFQQPLDLSQKFVSSLADPTKLKEFIGNQYDLPYLFIHPKRVLIMGSGTGNDVAAALRHGVEHIDAVEIDPLMIKLGHELHAEHPYESPKVNAMVNDARAFLRQSHDKYDLIMTGLLDSHTVAGNSLSVRLDDYVYTVNGMRDAMSHLADHGLYSISYCAAQDWVSDRMAENLRIATREAGLAQPVILKKEDSHDWHMLTPMTEEMSKAVPQLLSSGFKDLTHMDTHGVNPSTDDWPYLYMAPATFDPMYLTTNMCILLMAWFACGQPIRQNRSSARWQFFFLGAGFLLLELAIIDRLALVFGTTWIVNSICIFAVLFAIILANILVIKKPGLFSPTVLYGGLFASLIAVYLVPLEKLTAIGMWAGGSVAAALSAVPIFFAGLIFSTAFAKESKPSVGLAFNMLGAVVGGLLEYVATYTGIRSLLIVACVLYAISFLFWRMASQKALQAEV